MILNKKFINYKIIYLVEFDLQHFFIQVHSKKITTSKFYLKFSFFELFAQT